MSKNISWIPKYKPDISGQSLCKKNNNNNEKSLKTAMCRPNPTAGYLGYQPDIKAFCSPDIMICHPLPKSIP